MSKPSQRVTRQNPQHGHAFAAEVTQLHDSLQNNQTTASTSIHCLTDQAGLATLVDQLLNLQSQLSGFHGVDIGYHYTNAIGGAGTSPSAVDIQNGMVNPDAGGSFAGKGTYTSNNPFAHNNIGRVGFIVLRLKGDTEQVQFCMRNASGSNTTTGIANGGTFREIVILRDARNCVPLIQFSPSMVNTHNDAAPENATLYAYHTGLQVIVDKVFNGGFSTNVPLVLPSSRLSNWRRATYRPPKRAAPSKSSGKNGTNKNSTDSTLASGSVDENLRYSAPAKLSAKGGTIARYRGPKIDAGTECSICLCEISSADKKDPPSILTKCKHLFHKSCIEGAMNHSSRCPVCRVLSSEPCGACPSGTMDVETDTTLFCSGVDDSKGTIIINYNIPSGTQREYNQNPGLRFHGASRTAFVPDTPDGRKLVKRLKYGFMHGLNFTVGTSMTNGSSNCVTWSSVHHKTTTCPDTHGYPDIGYIINCNEELTALGVPDADEC